MKPPGEHHAALLHTLSQARHALHRGRRDVVPREVYHALMAALGIPAVTTTERGTGFHYTLEQHVPDLRGCCTRCASDSDVDDVPWPCPDVRGVQRVLRELGWLT